MEVGELQALGGVPGEEQGLLVEVRVDEEHVRAYPDDDEDGEAHHQAQLSTTTGQHKDSKRCWDGEHHQGESHQGQEGTPCVEGGINQHEAVGHDGLPAAPTTALLGLGRVLLARLFYTSALTRVEHGIATHGSKSLIG